MSKRTEKIRRADKAREILSEVKELTTRQIDMVVLAITSMPDDVAESMLARIEKNPESIMADLRIPAKR